MKHVAVRLSLIAEKGKRVWGYERAVLARATSKSDTHAIIPVEAYEALRVKYAGRGLPPGPGSWTKWLLSWFRIVATHGCSCNKMAKKMNEMGEWWCLTAGRREILATMAAEAEKRKMRFRRWQATMLIVAAVALSWIERAVFEEKSTARHS
jgi:hypothetical protein